MLPEGWIYANIGEIIGHRKGHPFKSNTYKTHGTRVIRISDTTSNSIHSLNPVFIENDGSENLDEFALKYGDIILTTVGSKPHLIDSMVGKAVRIPEEIDGALLNQNLVKLSPNDKFIISDILFLYLKSRNFIAYISDLVRGNANQVSISLKDIFAYRVLLPPLPEQKKIAAILSTWDRAIEGTEKLLANSQQQKKALMQQLLTGKKRLPGFTGEWKSYPLENILNVRKEKSLPSSKIPLFSLTIEGGITSKTDRYNREFLVKNKNEKKYKVVYPRDLVYNPANLRWGAINYSRVPHKVVVSPIYEVLYVNNIERFFPDIIYQCLMSPFQIEKFSSMIEGTLMERKAVKISPFLATKIRIPCDFSEQKAIASVLTTADKEITAIESDLTRLRQEKKALMQQLLTGKRRVTVD